MKTIKYGNVIKHRKFLDVAFQVMDSTLADDGLSLRITGFFISQNYRHVFSGREEIKVKLADLIGDWEYAKRYPTEETANKWNKITEV